MQEDKKKAAKSMKAYPVNSVAHAKDKEETEDNKNYASSENSDDSDGDTNSSDSNDNGNGESEGKSNDDDDEVVVDSDTYNDDIPWHKQVGAAIVIPVCLCHSRHA